MTDYQAFLIQALTRDLDDVVDFVRFFPKDAVDREIRPGEWTLRQHLQHMRITEERYLLRLEGILATGAHVLPPPPQGAQQSDEPLDVTLEAYRAAGHRLIDLFQSLTDDQWRLVFNHPTIWGDISVEWWAHQVIQHTAEHVDEFWTLRKFAGLTPEALERVTRPAIA